jgi:hypothetical protein
MAGIQPNAQYNVSAAGSLPVRIAAQQRRKMFNRFMLDTALSQNRLRRTTRQASWTKPANKRPSG